MTLVGFHAYHASSTSESLPIPLVFLPIFSASVSFRFYTCVVGCTFANETRPPPGADNCALNKEKTALLDHLTFPISPFVHPTNDRVTVSAQRASSLEKQQDRTYITRERKKVSLICLHAYHAHSLKSYLKPIPLIFVCAPATRS